MTSAPVQYLRRIPRTRQWSFGKPTHWLISIALYAFFAIFLIYPIWSVVAAGFTKKGGGFTLEYVRLIALDPMLRRGLLNATIIAVVVTFSTLLISMPLAILSVRYDFRGRSVLSGLLLAPLVLPPFVGAIGMRMVLGRLGPLTMLVHGPPTGIDWLGKYRLAGIIVVEVLHLYPVLLLNLQASLASIDPAMEQAAANLGASRWKVFRKITLPLARPGLFAGCTLTLIWSFTELGTPLMFDFSTITPVQIFRQITDVSDNPLPYALVVVTLVASAGLYLVGKVLLGRGYESATTKASTASTAHRLTGFRSIAAALPFIIVLGLAIIPHIAVVLTSVTSTGQWYRSILPQSFTFGHYSDALRDDLTMSSVINSVKYAMLATIFAVIIGVTAAIVIVRGEIPGRGLIDALAMLPLAVPGLVMAFGYLAISVSINQKFPHLVERVSWLSAIENPIVFLVIAYAGRRLPYVVRSAVAGLQQTPRDLELAGANLGASRSRVLMRITVPLIMASLIAGALLAFAFALLEVSDSLILAQRAAYFPITRAILELGQRLGDGLYIASALGVWAMALLTLTIILASSLLGRRMGAIFRV